MERLTELNVLSYLSGIKTGHLKFGVDERKAFDLLAAYEDTGLTPEEIIELKHTWRAATKAFGFNNIPGEGGNDEAD